MQWQTKEERKSRNRIRKPRHPDMKLAGRDFLGGIFACFNAANSTGSIIRLLFSRASWWNKYLFPLMPQAYALGLFPVHRLKAWLRRSVQKIRAGVHIAHCRARSGKVIKSYLHANYVNYVNTLAKGCFFSFQFWSC